MVRADERAAKQPRQTPSSAGFERILAQLTQRLDRTEKKVTGLEKKLKKVEVEREEFKSLYTKAMSKTRERDKQIETLTAKLDCAEKQLAWFRRQKFVSGVEWSGHLASKLFSIFQTWLLNGLEPQALLLDYFNQCSLNPGEPPPSIDNFLPWKMNELRLTEFRLPDSYKRPA
jgi:predicted  nucleic acid-binding Zn-ribbon protein